MAYCNFALACMFSEGAEERNAEPTLRKIEFGFNFSHHVHSLGL